MNQNIIKLSFLLIKNKKNKLFNFDNYFWKLLVILDFNKIIFNLKFDKEYKLLLVKLKKNCIVF
jgi:hypothetical protein